MRKVISVILVAVIFITLSAFILVPPAVAPAGAFEIPVICAWAGYNPTYAAMCLAMIIFELWDPLDWGDG